MTRIYFIRNTSAVGPGEFTVTGNNALLDQESRRLALKLGKKLETLQLDMIYSSCHPASLDTAKLLTGFKKGLPVISDCRLNPLKMGDWMGHSPQEIDEKENGSFTRWLNNPLENKIPGGEDIISFKGRIEEFLKEITRTKEGKNIGIISHRMVFKVAFTILLDMDIRNFSKLLVERGSISTFEIEDNIIRCRNLNDKCHLL